MTEKTIYCLFSVDNLYDQPPNNLIAWWSDKPSFDALAKAIGFAKGFPCEADKDTLAIVNIWQGNNESVYDRTKYRLEQVAEGKTL